MMLVGLDIGGTKIEAKVLSEQGEERFVHRVPTPDNYPEFLDCVEGLVALVKQEVGEFTRIGCGLPGAVSPVTGLMQNANSVFLIGQDVIGDLSQRLSMDVRIANDANCFALSEAVDGAGKGGEIVFGAILGTGCGGGVVINQQVLTGANAISGEWGHNPLPGYDPQVDGDIGPCYCGRQRCIEQYISGTGFSDQYNHKYGKSLKPKQIMELVAQGDAEATAAYRLLVDQMARSFATVTNILDPHTIVFGGGLSNIDSLYPDVSEAITQYIFAAEPKVNIRKAKYGDSSGVRGAAWLAR